MFCPTCGAADQLGPTCARCSAPLTPGGLSPMVMVAAPRTSGMAIAGFVLAFFCGLLGSIFSALALGEIKRSNGTLAGEGLATAGLVLSIVSMVIGVLVVGAR